VYAITSEGMGSITDDNNFICAMTVQERREKVKREGDPFYHSA
jgi:hypothetical protein